MMDVSVPLNGKEAAVNDETIIPALVSLLNDVDSEVKANAAGALMTITITTKGCKIPYNHLSEISFLVIALMKDRIDKPKYYFYNCC